MKDSYSYCFNNPLKDIDPSGYLSDAESWNRAMYESRLRRCGISQADIWLMENDFQWDGYFDTPYSTSSIAGNGYYRYYTAINGVQPGNPKRFTNGYWVKEYGNSVYYIRNPLDFNEIGEISEVIVCERFVPYLINSSAPSGQGVNYNDQYAGAIEKLAGKPYVLGADGPKAYDCSSTACYGIRTVANSKFGDYTAHDLYKKFSVPSSSKTRGSVIFYDYTSDGRIDHITTILNSSNMLHPSSGAGVLQIKPINYLDSYTNNKGGTIYYREFNWLIINKTK